MVSFNLCGWRGSAVRLGCLPLSWLPLNQEPSSIYCSQRKSLTLPRKIRPGKKRTFLLFLLDTHFSASVSSPFLYLQLCISFAFVWIVLFFQDVQFNFCTGKKKKLACCLSASVCSAEALLNWGQSRNWLDSFTLKMAPLLEVYARWNNCTV